MPQTPIGPHLPAALPHPVRGSAPVCPRPPAPGAARCAWTLAAPGATPSPAGSACTGPGRWWWTARAVGVKELAGRVLLAVRAGSCAAAQGALASNTHVPGLGGPGARRRWRLLVGGCAGPRPAGRLLLGLGHGDGPGRHVWRWLIKAIPYRGTQIALQSSAQVLWAIARIGQAQQATAGWAGGAWTALFAIERCRAFGPSSASARS